MRFQLTVHQCIRKEKYDVIKLLMQLIKRHMACKLLIMKWGSSLVLCNSRTFSLHFECTCLCACVLVLVVYGWEGWCKKKVLCSLFLSLCLSYWCFPSKSLLSPFFSPTLCLFVSLSLYSSHCLSPLISPFGPAAAAAGKVFFLLMFSLCTLSACSSDRSGLGQANVSIANIIWESIRLEKNINVWQGFQGHTYLFLSFAHWLCSCERTPS